MYLDYHTKNWMDAFYEMLGYVEAYAESHPDAKRMFAYMQHLRDDVLSFDEFTDDFKKEV